jgi:cytochrome c
MVSTMRRIAPVGVTILALFTAAALGAEADPGQGARVFRACAACHSLEANRNMTGPSLAGVWNRKAGGLVSFTRYSGGINSAGFLKYPSRLCSSHVMPESFMATFPGIPDDTARASVIAFLKAGTDAPKENQTAQSQAGMGPMQGMRQVPKLKTVDASSRVKSITYCRDTFTVTTEDGKSRDFWERNLRYKTDSSDEGPDKNVPAILAAGMMGDRASVVFASPDEIGRFITPHC